MSYPIIFIHKGLQDYFIHALNQAKKFKNERIIVIGDQDKSKYPKFVEFYNIADLTSEKLEYFRKIYKHSSINPPDYERFCLERWLIILELQKRLNIEGFLHLDSDILIFCNASKEQALYKDYDMTVNICYNPNEANGHSSYFNSRSALEKFTDFIIEFYENVDDYSYLFNKKGLEEGCINVSDMTLIGLYYKKYKDKVYNCGFEDTRDDEPIYDVNINSLFQTFDCEGKIIFKASSDGLCCILPNGKSYAYKTLHFQGIAKPLMRNIINKKEFVITKDLLKNPQKLYWYERIFYLERERNHIKLKLLGFIKLSFRFGGKNNDRKNKHKVNRIFNPLLKRLCFALCSLLHYDSEKFNYKIRNFLYSLTGMNIGKKVYISRGFDVFNPDNIFLDDFVCLGQNNSIQAFAPVKIGKYVQTAKGVTIIAGSHNTHDYGAHQCKQDVNIGAGCWIGTGVTILGGVSIGEGSVIGACSLVNNDIPPFSIAVGSPCKVIKNRVPADIIVHPARNYSINEIKDNKEYEYGQK